MATQLDLQEQEQLDALKAFWNKHGNLITWTAGAGAGRLRGLERLAVVPARPGGEGRCDVRRTRPRRAGRRRRASRPRLRRPEGRAIPAHRLRAAGRPAGRQGAVRQGPGRRRQGLAGLGGRAMPSKTKCAPSRACAWPRCRPKRSSTTRRCKTLAAAHDTGLRGPGGRTAAATSCWPRARRTRRAAAYQAAYQAMGERVDYRRLIEAKLTALGAAPAASAASAQPPR